MTCKDCIHYNVCNMYDGPYISVHLEHTCENFTDRSEWVHLPYNIGKTAYYGDPCSTEVIGNIWDNPDYREEGESIGNGQNRRV